MKTKFFMAALLVAVFTGCSEKNSYEDTSLKKSEVADNVSNGYANGSAEQSTPEAAEEERNAAATETSDKSANQQAGGFISSSAARVNSDTSRKFVRTANMRFRVKDVRQSTFDIEDIVDGYGGFVSYTTLNSSVSSRTEIPVSKDSILITTRYTVSNNMTIRIPNEKLDSALLPLQGGFLLQVGRRVSSKIPFCSPQRSEQQTLFRPQGRGGNGVCVNRQRCSGRAWRRLRSEPPWRRSARGVACAPRG